MLADRVDHVAARSPVVEHRGDQLRGILEVGVEHHHGVAAGVVQAGRERGLVAEVARQVDDAHPRVALGQPLEHRRRAVAGAVVDQHQLERKSLQRGADARVELLDRRLLVVDGRDDAHQVERPGVRLRGGRGTRSSLNPRWRLKPRAEPHRPAIADAVGNVAHHLDHQHDTGHRDRRPEQPPVAPRAASGSSQATYHGSSELAATSIATVAHPAPSIQSV